MSPQERKLERALAMLLHRLGGYVHLVRADYQATEGKRVVVAGKLGASVMLELIDEGE